jgi:hypothetical protein
MRQEREAIANHRIMTYDKLSSAQCLTSRPRAQNHQFEKGGFNQQLRPIKDEKAANMSFFLPQTPPDVSFGQKQGK